MLEGQMQEMRDLPERVTRLETQNVQLRQEMRDEFSATRSGFGSELAQAVTTLRVEMATKNDLAEAVTTLRDEIAGAVSTLTKAIGETNAQMRMLHEEALSRIATLGEARRSRKRRS